MTSESNRMNSEIKTLWVNALRSGEYKQGRGTLIRNALLGEEYCCLGVLCDLAVKQGLCKKSQGLRGCDSFTDGECYYLSLPPDSIIKWAGLFFSHKNEADICNPSFTADDGTESFLAVMNDSGNYNFNQIADIIEREF